MLNLNLAYYFDAKAMNGPTTIYRLQPVFGIPRKLDLPACMYKMKNLVACVSDENDHTDDEKEVLAGIMDKVKDILKKPLPELASLESRWDSVLKQLSELKLQLETVKKSVSESCELTSCSVMDSMTLDNLRMLQGAVINASPFSPPYCLLLLKYIYRSSLPISIFSHVHSSVKSPPDNIKCFNELSSEANCGLKLRLIWKDGITDTELVINPIKQLPVRGEVNILRLLARSGLKLLKYPSDDLIETIHTDSILDSCHRLLHVTNTKEKASLFRNLNAKLGKSLYFGGDNINISDVSIWSALKQSNINPAQDLTPSLAKWYGEVDKILF